MTRRRAAIALVVGVSLVAAPLAAQDPLSHYSDAFEPQFDAGQPVVHYTVRVDPGNRSGYHVEMRVRNASDTLRVALPVWAPGAYRLVLFARYVRDLAVESGGRTVAVTREDSSTWRAVTRGGEAIIRYRIVYPSATAAAAANNRAFLRETGALLDGPATYLYVVGAKLAPAHVRFDVPSTWRIATGLVPTHDPRTYLATSYDVLIDSPVLMGELRIWPFEVDGVPHRVAYWPQPDAADFDTAAFVQSIRRVVLAAPEVFGRLPYREYVFLFVDGAGGGLEHLNSSTNGALSTVLARDPLARVGLAAHEFVHTWNVKRIRPIALGPFDYQRPVRTLDLWFSEGVTDFYADEILRRTGFTDERAARTALAASITSYLDNPAHARISPQRSSWTAWDRPGVNDGYSISYYLQGALIGEMLEILIRDSTAMRRGMDDVGRYLFERYAAERGFTSEELVYAVNAVCGCDLQRFFDLHVHGSVPIDFDRYLAPLGWRVRVERRRAVDGRGDARADLRVGLIGFAGVGSAGGAAGSPPLLSVSDPTSAWGRAGLATGDVLRLLDGNPINDNDALRRAFAGKTVGDTVRVVIERDGRPHSALVVLTPYDELTVTLADAPSLTARQRALRELWFRGGEAP